MVINFATITPTDALNSVRMGMMGIAEMDKLNQELREMVLLIDAMGRA